jgi:hypothetical protein
MRILPVLIVIAAAAGSAGCGSVTIDELEDASALQVTLDANARTLATNVPHKMKFFVDITNQASSPLSLARLKIELLACRASQPGEVQLRQAWTYRHPEEVQVKPSRKVTVPIVPEKGSGQIPNAPAGTASEFPLELLAAGDYDIVALVNGRFRSAPYRLKVLRPDLQARR